MKSYRESHTQQGKGEAYDKSHENKYDAVIWDTFVKPYLKNILKSTSEQGAKKYLDFACGTGRILNQSNYFFDDITGIDISEEMLKVAKKRVPNAVYYCHDVTANNNISLKFDCITLFRFVLNAEPELRKEILHWLFCHIEDDGVLIFNNHMNLYSFRGLITWLARCFGNKQVNYLTKKQITHDLRLTGFTIVSCKGFWLLPTVNGKPILGTKLQTWLEKRLIKIGFGFLGAEQVYVVKKSAVNS